MKRCVAVLLCFVMTAVSGSVFAQAGAPAKVIPIGQLKASRIASTDYPAKAQEVRSLVPRPATGDGVFDAKTQRLASNYEKELNGLDNTMRETSLELRRDRADQKKIKILAGKIERHVKALKKKQSELKAHLAKTITSEKSPGRTYAAAYENFDRKAGELYDVISTVLKNMR
jgi:hypothetical protein